MGEREKIATGYAGEDFVGGYAVKAAEQCRYSAESEMFEQRRPRLERRR